MKALGLLRILESCVDSYYQEAQDPAGVTIELEEAERMSPPSSPSSNDDSTEDVNHLNQAEGLAGILK